MGVGRDQSGQADSDSDVPPWNAGGEEADGGESGEILQAAAPGAYADAQERPVRAAAPTDARRREEQRLELWAAGEKRELQERWTHELVADATARIVETQPDYEMNFKLDGVSIRAKMEEYGKSVHIARLNGRYVVLVEGDAFRFDKGISPIELLSPEPFDDVVARIAEESDRRVVEEREARWREREERDAAASAGSHGVSSESADDGDAAGSDDRGDKLPWE
ncbi:DUF3898 domain-containing protein [Gorillibacterium sp. CAU 1737]|uniref:DUF3898 domain-containing protein n=1 Tax=Gorillibacterium sp. CAU 1737 TaxID=3140362 RepID=UPI003261AAF4